MCVLQRTFEYKENENEKVKKEVGVNVRENYTTYHIQDGDSEVSVIQDFNRVSKANVKLDIIHTLACLHTNVQLIKFDNINSF